MPTYEDFHNARKTTNQNSEPVNPIYAKIEDYPFMASIYIDCGNVAMRCGGTLIHSKWILTAAHCITPPSGSTVKKITVCMGVSYLPNAWRCTNKRGVKKIAKPMSNLDIALLQLSEPYPLSRTINVLQLKEYDLDELPKVCKVLGYGWMHPGYSSPNLLQANVIRIDSCVKKHVCVMSLTHAPCKGDSGGPLICNGMLVGVASVGENADCERNSGVTVYVSVWDNKKFISTTLNMTDSGIKPRIDLKLSIIIIFLCTIKRGLK